MEPSEPHSVEITPQKGYFDYQRYDNLSTKLNEIDKKIVTDQPWIEIPPLPLPQEEIKQIKETLEKGGINLIGQALRSGNESYSVLQNIDTLFRLSQDSKDPWFQERIIELTTEEQKYIEEQSNQDRNSTDIFRLLANIAPILDLTSKKTTKAEDRQIAIRSVLNNSTLALKLLLEDHVGLNNATVYKYFLPAIYRYSSEQEFSSLQSSLIACLENPNITYQKTKEIIYSFFKTPDTMQILGIPETEREEVLRRRLFLNLELDSKEMSDSWQKSGTSYVDNLSTIYSLARIVGKDAILTLIKEFGIENFSRYPIELLAKQFLEKDNNNSPYGTLIVTKREEEGQAAFHNLQEFSRKLMEDIDKQGYSLRITEANSRSELVKRMNELRKKYGRISFVIVGAHGSETNIAIGGEKQKKLSLEDLTRKRVESLKSVFIENPTIILISCSTGRIGGIAQRISQALGATVLAPNLSAPIDSVETSRDNSDNLQFEVKFKPGTSHPLENSKPTTTMRYENGTLININY